MLHLTREGKIIGSGKVAVGDPVLVSPEAVAWAERAMANPSPVVCEKRMALLRSRLERSQ